MTNQCKHCNAKTALQLCNPCTAKLQATLTDLPWLIKQIDVTVARQDKLTTGTVGKSGETPSPVNIGALDISRDIRTTLLNAHTVITALPGLPPMRLDHVKTADLARLLAANTHRIRHHPQAGTIYADITALVQDDELGRNAPTWKAINRTIRVFAGPCPTTMGHNHKGEPIHCGEFLYADNDDPFAKCPRCDATIDVKKNRMKAHVDRDLLTEKKLLEVLDDLDEKVSRVKFYEWRRAGRITARGFVHEGQIVQFRIRKTDPSVFSLSRARALRAQEETKENNTHV